MEQVPFWHHEKKKSLQICKWESVAESILNCFLKRAEQIVEQFAVVLYNQTSLQLVEVWPQKKLKILYRRLKNDQK